LPSGQEAHLLRLDRDRRRGDRNHRRVSAPVEWIAFDDGGFIVSKTTGKRVDIPEDREPIATTVCAEIIYINREPIL
jgi:hypothetical protein